MIDLTLLRHGRSSGDDLGIHEGRYDTILTERGRHQVEALVSRWQAEQRQFDRILSSPLQRAQMTARIIATPLQLELTLEPLWQEMDNGPLAGLTWAEADRQYPWPAQRDPYAAFFGTGESDWAIHQRATQAVMQVVQHGPGRVLVVAHGGIISAALRHILGSPLPINRQGVHFALADTGYARVQYDPQRHQWWLVEFCRGDEYE